ncbi:methyltransferase [Nocardioides sp. R-C-SC26]|uniref:methyltransferase n=1 Tax=Nocardioides sp. R-C-SC26 TaxID=2870414 RepID=UPI001E38DE3B|nr:methyltransferase [Nocardioides sp. R-C-SC26]
MSQAVRRTTPRTAVVWDALAPLVGDGETAAPPLDVVDIGGGTGVSAVRLAAAGHRVTVVDPSPDALAALARRAEEHGVEVEGRQGDLVGVGELVGRASADLVLCHGVLEMVEDPSAALGVLRDVVRPGGHLSLLVAQRPAAVIARAVAGHFAQALAALDPKAPAGRTGRRFSHAEVVELARAAGFVIVSAHGVRVVADLVPGALLELEPGSTAALVELERALAPQPDYLPLATQVHLLVR